MADNSVSVRLKDVVALAKPQITFMVLCTTLGGLWIAPGHLGVALVAATLAGVTLVVAGANALNMYLERDVDGLMTRTQNRPLPTGRMAPETALAFGLLWSALGVPLLTFAVNPLTGFLGALSIVLYVLAYTPLKRKTTAALLVGAIPGAMPPLLGWTAATGSLDKPGLALFLVMFLWQLPHFIAISLFRASEYKRAGLKVLPAECGVHGSKQRIVLYTLLLVAASLQIVRLGVGGRFYPSAAYFLGAIFLGMAGWGLRTREPARDHRCAKRLFFYSLIYLPLLFVAMVIR